jgi:hypothetical protein
MSVNHSKFLKKPVLLIHAWPPAAMPESFFSLKRIEKQIKCLLGSLIPKSFRDVAFFKNMFLKKD